MTVRCFWLEPTDRVRLWLRRYVSMETDESCSSSYHNARTPIGEARALWGEADGVRILQQPFEVDRSDPRWPTHCAHCGREINDFEGADHWQVFQELIYRREDTGELLTTPEAPSGAMWDAWWSSFKGPDGRCLMAKCPDGHEWMIDGPARNCTAKDDREHRCWLRTGEPPRITVGKEAPGQRTCSAGAGSIGTPGYHGFLRDGVFT